MTSPNLNNQSNHDDLYSILGLTNKNATESEIKQAYRKACFKYHPDKNIHDDQSEAAKMFQLVAEAFLILSDPELRQKYDKGGREGLVEHKKSDEDDDEDDCRNSFTKYDSKIIFDRFFSSSDNPFGKMGLYDITGFNSTNEEQRSSTNNKRRPKMDAVYCDLPCTLEELGMGAVKVVNVERKRYLAESKKLVDESKILRLKLEPSWKTGMQINMHGEGDADETKEPGDLVFTIKEIPHQHFKRDEVNNLIFHANISLCEALTDCVVRVPTLSGKTLVISCPEIIHHNYERRLVGKGIPLQGNHASKSDLIIKFNIDYPKVINVDTKRQLNQLLSVI